MSIQSGDFMRRLAAALLVVAGSSGIWAMGLPREIYLPAMVAGGCLALWLVLRGPARTLAPTLALGWVALCVGVVLGDGLLRTALGNRLFPRPDLIFARRWPVNPDLHRYAPDGAFEGTTFGDLAAMTGRVEDRQAHEIAFRTDSRGFRNPPPLPEGPLEALLLGDSFGAGSTTHDAHTWLGQLREAWGIHIYNLSVPGSPWGELITLKTELPTLTVRPGARVLWALFTGNDLEDRYRDYLEPPPPNGRLEQLAISFTAFRRSSPLRRLWEGRFEASLRVERADHDPSFLYLSGYRDASRRSVREIESHENFTKLSRVFASMAELADERGLRVVVACVPTKWETYAWLLEPSQAHFSTRPSGFAQAMQGLARRHGFGFVDLKPALVTEAREAWREGAYVFWPDDTHWNGRGQAVAAQVVAPLLVE